MSPIAQNVAEATSHSSAATVPAWKMELNERLAATRMRRLREVPEQVALPGLEDLGQKGETRAARLAAKVAQRYANAPSYSEVLAADTRARAHQTAVPEARVQEVPTTAAAPAADTAAAFPDWRVAAGHEGNATAAAAADSEAPDTVAVLASTEEPQVVEPLAVNLIEFPRELVASRKMRPRLAEGPLRETADASLGEASHVRAEEHAAENASSGVHIGPAPSTWTPILLDEETPAHSRNSAAAVPATLLKAASLEDRIMAAIFDGALIVAAFAVFVLVFVACTAHPPTGRSALLAGGLLLTGLTVLYHYLFFRFAEGTPGMRYAKIALCTFEDENPTRQAMCRRVLFLLLSAAPLGLGFLWVCFDGDRLGWHDRISRMYQRSYS